MMTDILITKIEKTIEELEIQKQELLQRLEDNTWKDDRATIRLPAHTESTLNLEELINERVIGERAPLPPNFHSLYQLWYSAIRAIVTKNQQHRLIEIDDYYKKAKKILEQSHITKEETFYLIDIINHQFDLLASVPTYLRYSVYDIELEAYSKLSDDLLESAQHLLSKGFARPAGVMAGVVLERHLKNLLRKYNPPIKYTKSSTLSKLNDLCKETVYDLITWRKMQLLIDIRNFSAHDNTREPTKNEVDELIRGVKALVLTINS